ncbi:MAG TPA: hypothetical protein VMU88_05940 [bacterium]|nr:hypothetical protein [bacterium]
MEKANTNAWLAPLRQLGADLGSWAPDFLAALLVLVAGLTAAWLLRGFAAWFFKKLQLDDRLGHLWLFQLWSKRFQGSSASKSLASFVFYLVLFLAILLAIHLLGSEGGQTILASLLGVIPRVMSFMLILFLGSLLAMFFSVLAQLALVGSGAQHPSFWGKVIAWGTFGLTVMFSLEPLGLAGQFLTDLVLIALGVVGLGAAIALGLGCKDLAREFVIELLKEHRDDK